MTARSPLTADEIVEAIHHGTLAFADGGRHVPFAIDHRGATLDGRVCLRPDWATSPDGPPGVMALPFFIADVALPGCECTRVGFSEADAGRIHDALNARLSTAVAKRNRRRSRLIPTWALAAAPAASARP